MNFDSFGADKAKTQTQTCIYSHTYRDGQARRRTDGHYLDNRMSEIFDNVLVKYHIKTKTQ